MQDEVLRLLRQAADYISGEELSRQLGVTRTAIWKCITALRKEGYVIESATNRGYCLRTAPDVLTASEIADGLTTTYMGRNIVSLSTVDSTNEEAKRQANAGAPNGTLVVAESQTGGKGRLGRAWVSPPGEGIWMTLLLRPDIAPHEVTLITLVVGLAICRAVRAYTGCDARIKWPNDVIIGGRKICGILTELAAETDRINYVVVGAGTNVNMEAFPAELAAKATSLRIETGAPLRRAPLVRAILAELETWYDRLITETSADLIAPYKELCVSLNRRVCVLREGREIWGTAVDISPSGELIIETEEGEALSINSGEVTVQGVYGA